MKNIHSHSHSRAFTLIELLVVISIIGILSGIIVANFSSARAKTRDGKRISDIGNIQLALELFYDRCKSYPATLPNPNIDPSTTVCPTNNLIKLSDFISQIPAPPNSSLLTTHYYYYTNTNTNAYVLSTLLEKNNEALKDGAVYGTWGLGATCNNMGVGTAGEPYNYCVGAK